jgi:hypothetical protein
VKPAHRHPLDVGEQGLSQIGDDRFTQLESQPLAVMHHELRRESQQSEQPGPPDHTWNALLSHGPANHSCDHPGQCRQLDRPQDNGQQQPIPLGSVRSHELHQPHDQLVIERNLARLILSRDMASECAIEGTDGGSGHGRTGSLMIPALQMNHCSVISSVPHSFTEGKLSVVSSQQSASI